MTDWQWNVVLALCRVVLTLHVGNIKDLNLLEDALDKEEEKK